MSIILDGTSGITSPNETVTGQFSSGSTMGFKNRIINGNMAIDQRNAGASVTPTDGAYTLDRWQAGLTQSSKFSVQQSTTAATGFTNSLLCTSLSAYSVGSGDIFAVAHKIEGLNVSDLGWGTASAASVTLSFWVRSSLTGTFGGSLRNSAYTRSYPFTYTISAANTWEQKTITIAGDTSGTWLTTSGIGVNVTFSLGSGSTYSGTAGSWATANYTSTTGAVSVVGTSGATFYITGAQLEKGSTATSFDYRPYGTELALCQRYYETFINDGRYIIGFYQEGVYIYTPINFLVLKRATPTVTVPSAGGFDVWGIGAPSSIIANSINTRSTLIRFTSTGSNYYCYGLQGSASSIFQISAEL